MECPSRPARRPTNAETFVAAAHCASAVLTGFNVDGAHAEYLLAHVHGTVLSSDGLAYEQAAPRVAGFQGGWRRVNPQPGEVVAVVGIGGLGHLAVQQAKAAEFKTIAATYTKDKEALARKLGADKVVFDGVGLNKADGADVILTTGTHTA